MNLNRHMSNPLHTILGKALSVVKYSHAEKFPYPAMYQKDFEGIELVENIQCYLFPWFLGITA